MLEEIRIRGLGVIDDAELELGPGFTALTGETGAGKTMVLTALNLLLGGKADAGLVRGGSGRAVVEGRVRVVPDGPVATRALDAGADLDDESLLLGRVVHAEGRSRAQVGGRGVPAALLTELGGDLVAVHGQSDQLRLLQPARQRAALDRYAGDATAGLLGDYGTAYARLRAIDTELLELTARARDRAQEADLLRFGLAEVEKVDPQSGEDSALAEEADRLAHADALRTGASAAQLALAGDDSVTEGAADALSLLAAARRSLDTVRGHDPELARLGDRLAECTYLVSDVAADLASYAAAIDTDPARLATVQDRQAEIGALLRKYGADVEEVLAWARTAAARVNVLDGDDERIGELQAERAETAGRLGQLATLLSAARSSAADKFAAAVADELTALAMPHSRIEVTVKQTEAADGLELIDGRRVAYGATGVDEIEILLAPHRGAAPRPINRGASGGELSRVMLAIEVVLAGTDPVPTFVFDEVDAGVGGSAAVEVGRRLARLAATSQVIVVTHLPQVAAFADRHLRVVKSDDGRVTASGVSTLDEAGRVRELSRMLAGLEDSATAAAHAEELLAMAAADRSVKGTAR